MRMGTAPAGLSPDNTWDFRPGTLRRALHWCLNAPPGTDPSTNSSLPPTGDTPNLPSMIKRTLIVLFWAYVGTYAWNLYAGLAGLNWLLGPLAFLSVATLVLADRVLRSWPATVGDDNAFGAPQASAADPV